MSIITDSIDRILERNGMSKKDFYAALSISPSAYSQWKLEQSQPSLSKLYAAADILGVDIAEIVSTKHMMSYGDTPLLNNKKTATQADDGLNDEEQVLIRLFRILPAEHRAAIIRRLQELERLQKAQDDLLQF